MQKIIQFIAAFFTNNAPAIAGANPMVSLALFAVEEAIKQEPAIAEELKTLFASGQPTAADFTALHAKIAAESYAGFVPASRLPLETVTETPAKVIDAPAAPAVAAIPEQPHPVCTTCGKINPPDAAGNCNCPN